jgi:hypothetical protein
MDFRDIAAISELLNPEGEEDQMVSNPYSGSVFTPGDVGGKQQKEMAKPFSQVAVKGGRGEIKNEGVPSDPQTKPKTATSGDKKDIWAADEVTFTFKFRSKLCLRRKTKPVNDPRLLPCSSSQWHLKMFSVAGQE